MRDVAVIRERYLRDAVPVRLGGLAASLARVESLSEHPGHKEVVASLLEECRYFIEWTGAEADLETQVELMEVQRQLARWHYAWNEIWDDPVRRSSVAAEAGRWSRRILGFSGLVPPESSAGHPPEAAPRGDRPLRTI
ncbi:MAG: hypothetical protein AMJ46_13925 [Latescibacteria bacterium DG_63]|nr:MAG: hypothetical protein AMJ46_13925 [Latescibacteria bacterium DG_63]